MIDLQSLNDHSRQFATELFRRWPEWIRYARFDPYEDFEKEALLVEVPRPDSSRPHGLYITTSEWEISVGFGESFHTRFGPSNESPTPGDTNFYKEALTFISDFIDEKIALATATEGKEWLGAWKVDLSRERIEDIEVDPGVQVQIHSWLGTWDRELKSST